MQSQVGIGLAVCLLLVGSLMILGTILRWPLLTDPPESWAPFYSHSALKKYFGRDFLVVFNYVVGSLFLIIAAAILWSVFSRGMSPT